MSAAVADAKKESREDALAKFKRVFGIARAPAPVVQVSLCYLFFCANDSWHSPRPCLSTVGCRQIPCFHFQNAHSQSICAIDHGAFAFALIFVRADALANHQALAALAATTTAAAAAAAQRPLVRWSTRGTDGSQSACMFRVESLAKTSLCLIELRPVLVNIHCPQTIANENFELIRSLQSGGFANVVEVRLRPHSIVSIPAAAATAAVSLIPRATLY